MKTSYILSRNVKPVSALASNNSAAILTLNVTFYAFSIHAANHRNATPNLLYGNSPSFWVNTHDPHKICLQKLQLKIQHLSAVTSVWWKVKIRLMESFCTLISKSSVTVKQADVIIKKKLLFTSIKKETLTKISCII